MASSPQCDTLRFVRRQQALLMATVISTCLTGCAAPPQKVEPRYTAANNPAAWYMLNWRPERDYRPGFYAPGAQREPTLEEAVSFYDRLADVKARVLSGDYAEAKKIIRELRERDLPLERENLKRMYALLDSQPVLIKADEATPQLPTPLKKGADRE